MAASASKRRKVEHYRSDEETDDASFYSFSDSVKEEGSVVNDEEEIKPNDKLEDEADGSEDEEEQDLEDEAFSSEDEANEPTNASHTSKSQTRSKSDLRRRRSETGTHTAGTFKSNVFKIQVDDLLEQIRPSHGKKEAAAEATLHKLKSSIDKIPARGPLSIEDAERGLLMSNKVAVPFPSPRPPKDAKYKLTYEKPINTNVVGSYAFKTASRAKRTLEIDMVVTMPSSMFQEKDFLNYRYFYKRAYYLACIAAGLKETYAEEFRFRFRNFHDDSLKPILTVAPTQVWGPANEEKYTPKWQINVIPCVSDTVFAQEKLLSDRNCVRSSSDTAINGNDSEQNRIATPFYNSSLRSDMLTTSFLKALHSASKKCAAFLDACLLGSSWLRKRGFSSNIHAGGFGNFEFCALMAVLLETGGPGGRPVLGEGYSSYQLLKATLQFLSSKGASKEDFSTGKSDKILMMGTNGAPILWDSARYHNLLFKMTPWSYRLLKDEAKTTLSMLGDQQFDGFDAAFILQTDSPMYRYDYVLQLSASLIDKEPSKQVRVSMEGCQKLCDVLQRGLGDRISLLTITPQWTDTWDVSFAGPSPNLQRTLIVGLVVNPGTVNRTVDHGPSAEEKSEAASFRKFWGEKAELRRYKDGSILESLVWSGKEGGQSVLEQISQYVVNRHFGGDVEQNIKLIGDGFRRMLHQTSGSTFFQPLMDAYKKLEVDIRSLDNLPLSIRQITPSDAKLRYTSNALLGGLQLQEPADVVLLFEGSARWPDDLVAIQRTKIAFLLKISEQLQEAVGTLTSRVGLENQEHDILNQGFLDVVYDSGAVFRLRIQHDREQQLLERKLKDKTLDPRSKEIAALGLAKYKRDYIKGPAFTQAIAQLCSGFPALSGTIRLAKRWFASHLLSNHIADEIIEMLVVRTFVQPWPWQTPSSVQTGFLRTLSWISRCDWRAEPLVVDLSGSGELKPADLQAIKTKFEAWRKLDPALNRVVLFCGSNVDPDGIAWSDGRTPKVVAGRMTALARAACAEVEEKQLDLDPASLFSSPLSDFDFVIHLNPDVTRKGSRRKQATTNGHTFKNLEMDLHGDESRIGYQPVREFLKELDNLYSSALLLFSGLDEHALIAGLWNPQTAPRAWKLNLAYSTVPKIYSQQDEVQAEANREAILAEIARIGGDMVRRIEVNR